MRVVVKAKAFMENVIYEGFDPAKTDATKMKRSTTSAMATKKKRLTTMATNGMKTSIAKTKRA